MDRLLKTGSMWSASRFAAGDALAAQRDNFRHLIARGANTRFGADYGLAELVSCYLSANRRSRGAQVDQIKIGHKKRRHF